MRWRGAQGPEVLGDRAVGASVGYLLYVEASGSKSLILCVRSTLYHAPFLSYIQVRIGHTGAELSPRIGRRFCVCSCVLGVDPNNIPSSKATAWTPGWLQNLCNKQRYITVSDCSSHLGLLGV